MKTLLAAVTVLAVSTAQADTIFVDDDAPAGGDGTSWDTAHRYLRDALEVAADPLNGIAEIRVAQGTYRADQRTIDSTCCAANGDAGCDDADCENTVCELLPSCCDVGWDATCALVATVICPLLCAPHPRAATFQLVNGVAILGGYLGLSAGKSGDPNDRDPSKHPTILSGDLLGDDSPDSLNRQDNSFHVVTGSSTDETALLDGFFVTAGNANDLLAASSGGGLHCAAGSPTVVTCVFSQNTALVSGGAMANTDGSSPTLVSCAFVGNHSAVAGAMHNNGSSPTMINCLFTDNFCASAGGAISNVHDSDPILIDCYFEGNSAGTVGGAVYNRWHSAPVVMGCTFRNNSAYIGGAVNNDLDQGDTATFTNCIFIDNTATATNGAAFKNTASNPLIIGCLFTGNSGNAITNSHSGEPTVVNCTITGNIGRGFASAGPHGTVLNCILWGNTAEEIHDPGIVSYCLIEGGFAGAGNIDADPLFVDPDNGDYRLQPGSPCIDAADNTAVPEDIDTDLDGNLRFVDDPDTADSGNGDPPVVDMGAYEFQGLPCPWDLDGDGNVFVTDLLLVLMDFGSCEGSPADLDGDGCVTVLDLLTLLGNWGPCPGSPCIWDVNGDGTVDQTDLRLVLGNFGSCNGCPEDVNGDGVVNGQDAAAVATHFGPCP